MSDATIRAIDRVNKIQIHWQSVFLNMANCNNEELLNKALSRINKCGLMSHYLRRLLFTEIKIEPPILETSKTKV